MVGRRARNIPASLSRGRDRFENWRGSREVRSRIPNHLWDLAVKLAVAHGLNRTASILKLDYYSLKKRVETLAALRTAEGYMADVVQEKPGAYLLTEHHCPICEAATSCQGFCNAELDVFRKVLGRGVRIERVKHLLSGGDRCVYRIEAK